MKKSQLGAGVGAFLGTFTAVAVIAGMGGCGRGDDVLAVVNGETITMKDFYDYMQVKPDVQVRTANGVATLRVADSIGFQTMQDLIGQKIALQLAQDEKVYPTQADIESELKFQEKLSPNYVAQLTAQGLTLDTIKRSLTIDLAQERLLTKGVKITDQEVENYIKNNPKEFIDPAKADMSWILVRSKPLQEKVDAELKSGQSFTSVAQRYSDAPFARERSGKLLNEAGQIPTIASLPPDTQKAVTATKDQGTTEWIRFVDGWAKIMVHKHIPEKRVTMDDTKKLYLKRFLAKQRASQGKDLNKAILTKLKDSNVKIEQTRYRQSWQKAFEKFKLENKIEAATGGR